MNTPFPPQDAPAHPVPRRQSRSMRGFIIPAVFVILIIGFVLSLLYLSKKTPSVPQNISSYEECVGTPGSVIQESYPATCVTTDGQHFTQVIDGNTTPSATPSAESNDPVVSEPRSGSLTTSPFAVRGTVPAGWMFEGSFPITLLDENGKIISQTTAKEVNPGSWPSGLPVVFEAQFSFKTSAIKGTVVLKKDNPSGMPENDKSFEIPVVFKITGAESACTTSGGKFDAQYKECTGITNAACTQNGGTFNECASVCRHSSDPSAPCVMMCVALCQF